jgi:thiamine-monophosphate kinase
MRPFSQNPAEAVAALGESALLRAIRGWLAKVTLPPPRGIGDDCAVLDTPSTDAQLATTDGVVYGRHFDDTSSPAAVGEKLLKRNVSDIAAMGGRPGPALLNLLLAGNVSLAWLEQFYAGLAQACERYGVTLVGGDLAQGPDDFLAAHLTLLGTPGEKILCRAGAQIGDTLYVTGELGGSILGKHLDFAPRLDEGRWLAHQENVRGAIDITDGLAKDLPEILPPGADAVLDPALLPIAPAARTLAARDGRSALLHALIDGEDYELLFALAAVGDATAFEKDWRSHLRVPLSRLGVIAPARDAASGRDRQLRNPAGAPLLPPGAHGYEHLR